MFSTGRHGDFSLQRAFASVPGVAEGLVGMVTPLESLEMLRAAALTQLLSSKFSMPVASLLCCPGLMITLCPAVYRSGLVWISTPLTPGLGSWFSASVGSFVPVFWVLLHKQTLKVLWVQFQAAVIRWISQKGALLKWFGFPVHIKVMFRLYHCLLSMQ